MKKVYNSKEQLISLGGKGFKLNKLIKFIKRFKKKELIIVTEKTQLFQLKSSMKKDSWDINYFISD